MNLGTYLANNLDELQRSFKADEAAFEKRVADTTAKRVANNIELFGDPEKK